MSRVMSMNEIPTSSRNAGAGFHHLYFASGYVVAYFSGLGFLFPVPRQILIVQLRGGFLNQIRVALRLRSEAACAVDKSSPPRQIPYQESEF
ncbi:hypothetical protein BLA27_26280 [Brucella cytisi]|uniref:Uncharacterized protein n=1 Tax=Brucella cytisi TaxID=407152 RepID=A0A1J6HDR7_9HYPH|nr:hypothetical protein BLA27_26280 [Brucella cytisi]